MKRIQKLLTVLLLLATTVAFGQTYPVQVVPTIISPYSSKIADYSNAMVNRINLQLITTDLTVQNRPAQLHIKIQGNGMNAQSAAVLHSVQPIYLNGGEILSLGNTELAGYFQYSNLTGITTSQYSQPLPDGVYNICFQVYDVVTRQWLSQSSCATIYLMLNDPPMLNLPSNREQIAAGNFTNIVFSWTPRHLNATNVSYDYEIKEILNPDLDPAYAFEISPLLHKEEGLRTTTLLYDISKPVLVPGKRYAWRVKAVSTSGLAENSVFKNNGYSQIYYFTYASNCVAPQFLMSEQQSASRVKLMWQGDNSHQQYHVQYRKANVPGAAWFETFTVNTQTILSGLESGHTYEFRVGATCEPAQYGITQSYTYSGIRTFSLSNDENSTAYNCGIVPDITVTNQQPLGAMVVNETFLAGDFTVKVLDVSGANGVFSGSGYIQVPYLFDTRIGVVFNNVRINSDYQLVNGVVETTYDPTWGNVDYVDDLWDVNQNSETVNFPIDTIEVRNGEVIVKGPNGETETFPGGKDMVVTGSDGKSYYVDANGNVSGPYEQAPGGKPTPQNTDGVNDKGEVTALTAQGIKVTFAQADNAQYAYDSVAYNKSLTNEYKQVSGSYVPFKAVVNGNIEFFIANVSVTDATVNIDSLVFKTQNGVKVAAERIGTTNSFKLQLKGAQKFAIEEVQAAIKQGEKYKVAGVFKQVHISPREMRLRLVPTTGVNITEAKVNEIKAIYAKVGITLDVVVAPAFDISQHLVNGKVPSEDAKGDLSTYSATQNAIISDYKAGNQLEQAYYLFVTDKASSTGQGGYMRLNGQFGFVFDQSARTAAHELGHGAFKLEHPFRKYNQLSEGATTGIMDYASGADFLFTDWKQINDPAFKLYAFQGQSEGEFSKPHLTPDWKPFNYTDKGHLYYGYQTGIKPDINGVVYNISVTESNGSESKIYKWYEDRKVYAYNNSSTDTLVLDKITYNDNTRIALFWDNGQCGYSKLYFADWGFLKNKKGFNILDVTEPGKITGGETIACAATGNVQQGAFRNQDKCLGKDIATLNQQRIAFESLVANIENADLEALVNSINAMDICALREVKYVNVEKAVKKLGVQSGINNNMENAILRLMNSVAEENCNTFYTNVLIANNKEILKNLLNRMNNAVLYLFGDNNANYFLESLAYIASKVDSEAKKWNVINTIAKERYGKLGDYDEKAFGTIFNSLSEDQDLGTGEGVAKLFKQMLVEDCEHLSDFRKIYEIAKIRADNRELFANFTQSDHLTKDIEWGFDIIHIGEISWVKPKKVMLKQGNLQKTVEENALHNYYRWSAYLKDNPGTIALLQSDPDQFFNTFIQQLNDYLQIAETENDLFWANFQLTDCNSLTTALNQINVKESSKSLSKVNKQMRLDLLTKMFDCNQSGNTSAIIVGLDDALLKLAGSFDPGDKQVLTHIEGIGFDKIYTKLSGNRLSKFFLWVGAQVKSSGHYTALNKNQLYKADGSLKTYSDFILKLESNMFQFDNFSAKVVNKTNIKAKEDQTAYAYNQMVAVYVADDFTFLDQQFKQGDVLTMPMIQAYAMSNNNRNIVAEKTAWAAVDVVSLAVGVGEVKILFTVGNYARKAIIASDIIGSTAGLVVNVTNEGAIGPDLRFKIQMLALAASLPQLATSIKGVDNLISNVDNQINALSGASKADVKSYFTLVKTRLGANAAEFEKILEALESSNYSRMRQSYNNLSEDMKALFRADFRNADGTMLNQLNKQNSEFLEGWIKYRGKYPNAAICN